MWCKGEFEASSKNNAKDRIAWFNRSFTHQLWLSANANVIANSNCCCATAARPGPQAPERRVAVSASGLSESRNRFIAMHLEADAVAIIRNAHH